MISISERPVGAEQAQGPRLGPIVLGTDGSADADLALGAAADIARRAHVAVHVVSAWSVPVPPTPFGGYILPEGCVESLEECAIALVGAESARLLDAGVLLAVRHTAAGPPAQSILSLADEVEAGLIVVGSRGLGFVARLVMGSVSDEVVHNSHRPVLVLRGGAAAWPPARIVVGDDGSEIATSAVLHAARLGAVLGVPVIVATVIPHVPQSALDMPGMSIDAALAGARVPLEQRVAELSRRAGVPLEAWLGVGEPASTLLDEADGERAPSLIVVGRRGVGAMARMRHGSVSSEVLRASHSPVLVVPPPTHH